MLNYDFCAPTRLIYGKGAEQKVGPVLKPLAGKVLLHYGGSSIKRSGLYDTVVASLKEAGVDFVELGGVVPNPRIELVREGIELCRREGVELVLAVGGGSVIDSSKAIAVGFYHDGDVWDVYENSLRIDRALPVATVLTIPAAGSEVSNSSVISNMTKNIKIGLGCQATRPVVSFVNPELFFTLPKNQIANGVADMMSHIFERYFTNTLHTDLTDGMCESVLKTIMRNALIVYNDPTNYDAWCQIGLAGSIAHNDVLGIGRAQDWACHKMEHELSAFYDVAHGAGLAVLTPGWMRYVYKDNPAMFTQFAINVMGVSGSMRDPESLIHEGINRLCDFYRKLGLPASLKELGIGKEKLELMSRKTGIIGGLKKLGSDDILAIYNSVAE